MGGSAAIPALTEIVDDKDLDVRLAASCALAAMGQTNALATARAFIDHPNPFCRLASIGCLARCQIPEAADTLKQKAADKSDPLAQFATEALSDGLGRVLPDALADKDVRVRRAAVFLLLFFNEPAAIPLLRKASSDRDPEIREGARWTVRRLERMNRAQPRG
jgi:HEAT repeat protein